MSNEPPSDKDGKEEDKVVPPYMTKVGVARRLTEAVALPEDIRMKMKVLAQAQGKSEQEVLNELIIKGMASTDEELTYQLARRRVLGSITLDEAEIIMRKIGNIFGTWSNTPKPMTIQPTTQPEQKSNFDLTMDKAEKQAMEGLPPVTYAPEQQNNPTSQQAKQPSGYGQMLLGGMAKYIVDKVLDKDHPISKGIGKILEEKGAGFLEDLFKKLKEEGEL